MVIKELKVTYFGAEILFRLFTRARETIDSRLRDPEAITPLGTDEGDMVSPENRYHLNGETTRSVSPVISTFNGTSYYGHVTGARYVFLSMGAPDAAAAEQGIANQATYSDEYEDTDVNSLLSQCMFPDFAAIEAMGMAGTSRQ